MKENKESIILEGRMQQAVNELKATIGQRYPDAHFTLSHPEDEPNSVELTAIVDVEDPDDVLATVIERVVQLQVDEELPIHVVPIRTPERVTAYREQLQQAGRLARRKLPMFGLPLAE